MSELDSGTDRQIDQPMFWVTVVTILLFAIPVAIAGDTAGAYIQRAYDYLTQNFGVLYQWYGVGVLVFLVYLAISRYGKVRLGGSAGEIEFSTLSWVAMLFTAGVGAGLLYWAVIEWGYYIDAPPFGAEPRSAEAVEWAASYGIFHWGITGWAFFCLPALAISYAFYVRGIPQLRLSTGCSAYLRGGVGGKYGRFIDFLFMINLIGGTGTSLGLSTPMIAASLAEMSGYSHDFMLEFAVVLLCILIFGTSAVVGLQRGIRRLADLNMMLAIALLLFVLAAGPSLFILKTGTDSVGLVLQNFFRMNTWTDPIANSGFVEAWTVFYWAWWLAYAPYVGIFVARISRGRTIRQVITGMLLLGSLGAAVFFIVFGNYAMHLELSNTLAVTDIMKNQSEAAAITQVFTSLPFGQLALFVFFIVALIFVATTYDSASYTLASVTTRELHAGENPVWWNRLFWALALGVLPITLMSIDGGLKVVLSTTIVVSLPLLLVGVLLVLSLLKMLREDEVRHEA